MDGWRRRRGGHERLRTYTLTHSRERFAASCETVLRRQIERFDCNGSLCIAFMQKASAGRGRKVAVLRVLSFAEIVPRNWVATGPDTHCGSRLPRMAKEFFGTDGIRGVPGTPPLDDATLYA